MAENNKKKQIIQEAVRLTYELKEKIDGYEGDDSSKHISADKVSYSPESTAYITSSCTDVNQAINIIDSYVKSGFDAVNSNITDISYINGTTNIGEHASFGKHFASIFSVVITNDATDFSADVNIGGNLSVSGSSVFNGSVSLPSGTTVKNPDGKSYDLWAKINGNTVDIANEKEARARGDANLQSQIDTINATQNVIDIVATKADLDAYKNVVNISDKIEVLADESQDGANTIYSWDGKEWVLVGSKAAYYSKHETDQKLSEKQNKSYIWSELPDGIDGPASGIAKLVNELYSYFDGSTAKNAKADALGNNIHETYATKASLGDEISRAQGEENLIKSRLNYEISTRSSETNSLQKQIDGVNAAHNLVDIVGSFSELNQLDTSKLKFNDKVEVMRDEMNASATTIYRWNGSSWIFVGVLGSYYTKSESDKRYFRKGGDDDTSPNNYEDVIYTLSSSSGIIEINYGYGATVATQVSPAFKLISKITGDKTQIFPGELFTNGENDEYTDYRYDGITRSDNGKQTYNYSYPTVSGTIPVIYANGVDFVISDGTHSNTLPKKSGRLALQEEALASARTVEMSLDETGYKVGIVLKDANGRVISNDEVDLPIETMVVGGEYDDSAKEIVLTLQNHQKIRFNVSDLVAGYQKEVYTWTELPALSAA